MGVVCGQVVKTCPAYNWGTVLWGISF